jgi:hypothetical protein
METSSNEDGEIGTLTFLEDAGWQVEAPFPRLK